MSLAVHCDRDGCGSWIRTTTDLPNSFVAVMDLNTGTALGHACSLDCLMHWSAAHSEPTHAPLGEL